MALSYLKKTLLCCILLALCCLALFPKEILLRCVAWQTAHYCKKAFGARLHYETLSWEEGKIFFKKGRLHKAGELDVTFEKAALLPFVDLKHRRFGGELFLDQLKIVHQKKELRPVPHPPSPSFKLFSLQLDTTIRDGEIFLYDYLSKKSVVQHAFFDLTHHVNAQQTYGSINLALDPNSPKLVTHFFNEKGSHLRLAAIFKAQPFSLLSHLAGYFFQNYLPESVLHWDIVQGVVDGDMEMTLIEGAPLKMKGNVDFANVRGENHQLKLLAEMDQLSCDLDVDLSEISSIHGFVDLKGGRVALQEQGSIWEGMWDLKNVHSHICIKEGKVESSTLNGSFMGMEGEMVLDWQAHDILMQIGFRGSSKKMQTLLPEKVKKKFQEAFPDDFFTLKADLRRSPEGLRLEGDVTITDLQEEFYTLSFGCHLGDSEPEAEVENIIMQPFDFSLSRSVANFLDNLKKQFCLSQKRFGWFRAEKVPLEKFLAPFLLDETPMQLLGTADFKGTFDDCYLVIFYEGKNVELQSPYFLFQVDTIKQQPGSALTAVHYFDLKTWDHVGFLPLKDARYWQKNYDFHLEKTGAIVNFENREIRIQNIETLADEVELKGNVYLNIHSLEDIDLKIAVADLKGSATHTQQFLSHFKPSCIWQLPLEGTVVGNDESAFFHYHFNPSACLIEGRMQGKVTLSFVSPLMSLHDYEALVSYDCTKNEMQIEKGEGIVQFSKHQKALTLETPLLRLWGFPNFLMEVSCSLKDDEGPYLTLKGSSQKAGDIKKIHIYGEGREPFQTLEITAQQLADSTFVTDYACGNWSGEIESRFEKEGLAIKKFSCASPQKGGFNFTGEYHYQEKKLSGEIGAIKWDLARLSSLFKKSLSPWKPGGEVEGKGHLNWTLGKDLEAQISFLFKGLEFGGIYFGSGEDLRCLYSSQTGFSVEGLEVEIPREAGAEKYKLGRFHYDIQKQKVLFEGFDFSLPPEKLPWAAKLASELFPGKIHPMMMDWVEALKQNEPLEGRVSLEIDPHTVWFYLSLKDGVYFLSDKKLTLKNFQLVYDPQELHVSSQLFFHDHYYWLRLTTDSLTMKQGVLSLSEEPNSTRSLNAFWEREKDNRLSIRALQGAFCGIDAQLVQIGESTFPQIHLEGHIGIEPQKLSSLLTSSWKKKLKSSQLTGKYELEGTLTLNALDFSQCAFTGHAYGNNCRVKEVRVESFSSDLHYEEDSLHLSHLTLKDPAGVLFINQVLAECDPNETWRLYVDYAQLSDLRLSRLKSPWTQWSSKDKPFFRHLYVPTFVIENVSGDLRDPFSLKGSGKIEFTNLPKKTLFSNLLFIPTEITARIGLDFSCLVPAKGSIEYCIHDGKIFFTDLEMYSDGKRSRFYLAEGTDAFIDFKGNLSMKVKMKQYSLLMKLAEFFTISVKGTLLNPSYTLSNHRDDEDSL